MKSGQRVTWSFRGRIFLTVTALGALAGWVLMAGSQPRWPTEGGWSLAGEMLRAALSPAWSPESPTSITGQAGGSVLGEALGAARRTVVFALAACSLAALWGLLLGLLASRVFWQLLGRRPGTLRRLARGLSAALRSIHELLWAVVLLAALGLSNGTAVLAMAIPFSGIFAKVFSELLDESPRAASDALAGAGAGPAALVWWALLPSALPDLGAYALYRLECALRSSAVLGFFGFPTLGYYVAVAFENLHYREMWTHLYVMFVLIAGLEVWSSSLRRRWVG